MIRDVAAAVGFFDGDAHGGEQFARGDDVVGGTGATGDGDNRVVFDGEDDACDWVGTFARGQNAVERGCLRLVREGVGEAA